MLGLWSLGSAPMGLSLHVALKASLGDVLGACDALRSHGVTPLSFFGGETTEPSVIGWMPAATVYFRDPDGHLIEYLTMLEEPARADRGIVPWSDWKTDQPSADTIRRRPLHGSTRRAPSPVRGGGGLRRGAQRVRGGRADTLARPLDARGRHRGRRRRQPALLPARRFQVAHGRARCLRTDRRIPSRDRDRRDPAAGPRQARSPRDPVR